MSSDPTSKDFLKHVKKLVDPGSEGEWTEDDTLYLFQAFMRTGGKGVEAVFAPIANGSRYAERMQLLFSASNARTQRTMAEGAIPGYFHTDAKCTDPGPAELQALAAIGRQYVKNLKELAKASDDDELLGALKLIQGVKFVKARPTNFGVEDRDAQDLIHESIGGCIDEWESSSSSPVLVLGEAYYSIANRYELGYFFRWPLFEEQCAVDVFQPIFALWKLGASCTFAKETIFIHPL